VKRDRTALGYGRLAGDFSLIRTAPGNRGALQDRSSLQNWSLSEAILGNIIPDFPVVIKRFNLFAGTDHDLYLCFMSVKV
jgi:hypothetical protein